MTAELSPQQRHALETAPDQPLELLDPVTKKAYVLVTAELYRRIQALLGDEQYAVRDMSALLVDLSPEDWEDAANYDSPQP